MTIATDTPPAEMTNRELIDAIYLAVDRLRELLAQIIERRGYGNRL